MAAVVAAADRCQATCAAEAEWAACVGVADRVAVCEVAVPSVFGLVGRVDRHHSDRSVSSSSAAVGVHSTGRGDSMEASHVGVSSSGGVRRCDVGLVGMRWARRRCIASSGAEWDETYMSYDDC